jgi:ferredoxin-NADP reductase/bacterioferritin-associated ferredoxin
MKILLKLIFVLIFCVSASFANEKKSLISKCAELFSDPFNSAAKETLRAAKAKELADIIAVDPETQVLVSDPRIAQYLYLNYFAGKTGQNELRLALQDVADSFELGQQDLYALVNNKLAQKLKDPEIIRKVQEANATDDSALRPGPFRAKVFNTKARMKQLAMLPVTTMRLKKLTDEGFSVEVLDRGLFDFYGATQLGLKESQLRPWDHIPDGFSSIRPGQIENMSADLWGRLALFASETEAPIHGYSTNSGDAFRAVLPSVSAFMGKNQEQFLAYQAKVEKASGEGIIKGRHEFCTNVWCREENRHEDAVKNIADHVRGKPKDGPSTYYADAMGDPIDVDYAIKHLAGRNSSEWNANSIYFLLRAHSKDGAAANRWIDNIRKDETKHMAIFSSAYRYFFGTQPGKRTKEMIDKIMMLKKEAAVSNSSSSVLTEGESPSMLEMAITHLFVEKKVREYNRTVPLKTMEKMFDAPVLTIKPLESATVPAEKQKMIDEVTVREKKNRADLSRWLPAEREKYLALKKVEQEQAPLIEGLVANLFDGYRGAEVYNSPAAKKVLAQIDKLRTGLDKNTNDLIQLSLRETLRDYQIMNNAFVRSKPELIVVFKNAQEGFVVKHRETGEVKVLLAQKVNDTSYLMRVEKPLGFPLTPGMAMRITIDSPTGKQVRTLSLASSPTKDYVEFAVRDSDSEFKKMFRTIKPGTHVVVAPAKGAMDFKPDKPAVMLAAGIGITPFRSMINYVKDSGEKTPMWLFYGNRDQIPFENELNTIAATTPQVKVTHVLSNPGAQWQGAKGRVDEAFLKEVVPTLPNDAVYYIVGPPQMVMATKGALQGLGIPNDRISIEIFPTKGGPGISNKVEESAEGSAVVKKSDRDETICFCHSVSAGVITDAIAGGATTIEKVQASTMAATGCGGCRCNVEKMLVCQARKLAEKK